jgi:hypothetical protein
VARSAASDRRGGDRRGEARARCVMTTYDPDTQVQDPAVLRRIVREFGGTMALDCAVEAVGTVRAGIRSCCCRGSQARSPIQRAAPGFAGSDPIPGVRGVHGPPDTVVVRCTQLVLILAMLHHRHAHGACVWL